MRRHNFFKDVSRHLSGSFYSSVFNFLTDQFFRSKKLQFLSHVLEGVAGVSVGHHLSLNSVVRLL